jgi:hypothetical protein
MAGLIPKFLKELISPGNHLKIYFIILIASLLVGFCCAHFFKGNKKAKTIETYAEKIIERETGVAINFDELDNDFLGPEPLPELNHNLLPTLSLPQSMP